MELWFTQLGYIEGSEWGREGWVVLLLIFILSGGRELQRQPPNLNTHTLHVHLMQRSSRHARACMRAAFILTLADGEESQNIAT